MLGLLIGLGSWQMQRGLTKVRLQAAIDVSISQAPQALDRHSPAAGADAIAHVSARGHYDNARQLLLDDQGHEGRPGYHVWTPLRLDDGGLLMVDRGWVPQAGDRRELPTTAVNGDGRTVTGLWRPLPRPGVRFADNACVAGGWPRVVQYPVAADLRCLYGETPMAGLLLLDPDAGDGFVRDWRINASVPPQRHYAYAVQWYLFAAVLLFFFIKLNLRRPAS